jgi:hypothetical protein
MILIASLIESPIAKNADVAKTQDPLSEFRQGHLRVIWFRWARFQREVQLKQLEQFLEQNPTIARASSKSGSARRLLLIVQHRLRGGFAQF